MTFAWSAVSSTENAGKMTAQAFLVCDDMIQIINKSLQVVWPRLPSSIVAICFEQVVVAIQSDVRFSSRTCNFQTSNTSHNIYTS